MEDGKNVKSRNCRVAKPQNCKIAKYEPVTMNHHWNCELWKEKL